MDSSKSIAHRTVTSFFSRLSLNQVWFYALTEPVYNHQSLFSAFDLTSDVYYKLLVSLGWAVRAGKMDDGSDKYNIRYTNIQQFVDSDVFLQSFVQPYKFFIKKKCHYFLRVGQKNKVEGELDPLTIYDQQVDLLPPLIPTETITEFRARIEEFEFSLQEEATIEEAGNKEEDVETPDK